MLHCYTSGPSTVEDCVYVGECVPKVDLLHESVVAHTLHACMHRCEIISEEEGQAKREICSHVTQYERPDEEMAGLEKNVVYGQFLGGRHVGRMPAQG